VGDVDSPEYRSRRGIGDRADLAQSGSEKRGQLSTAPAMSKSAFQRTVSLSYAIVQLERADDEGIAAFQRLRDQMSAASNWKSCMGGELGHLRRYSRNSWRATFWHAELVSFIALALLLVWVFGSVLRRRCR
jgi:predicted short-subunit dehydrogenase-like oxidoreductase (DUF2520 family)